MTPRLTRRALLGAPARFAVAGVAAPGLAQGRWAGTLRFIPQADLATLDPLNTTAYLTRNHGHLCWDTL